MLDDKRTYSMPLDTSKILSGGIYTLNRIIPEEHLKLTKGKLKTYNTTVIPVSSRTASKFRSAFLDRLPYKAVNCYY
jgi:hypothetical protein